MELSYKALNSDHEFFFSTINLLCSMFDFKTSNFDIFGGFAFLNPSTGSTSIFCLLDEF